MKRQSLDRSINNYKDVVSYLAERNYDDSKNSSRNIEMLSTDLITIFQDNPSIKMIIVGTRDDDGNPYLDSWKVQAVYEALKTNSSIQYLELNNCIENTDSAFALGELLKVNTSLRSLKITENDAPTLESAVLIAEGIKLNRGLKSLGFYYESEEGGQQLITALQDNQSITHFVNHWGLPTHNFHELLLNNKNLTQIRMRTPSLEDFVDNEYQGNINQLSDAIKIHPNLREFMLDDSDYRYYDPLNQNMLESDRNTFNFLKTILTGSRTLEMVNYAYVKGDFFSETALSQLMANKILVNDKFIKALETLNKSNHLTLAQKSGIVAYFDKTGKNFIKEKLKYVDWDNADLIKEYAEIYEVEELKQYDATRGLVGFTEKQKNIWQAMFKQHVVVFDDKQEASALRIINAAEQYRNDNFFCLKAITKDICKIGLVPELWSKIASYCESPHYQTNALEASIELVGDEVSTEVV